MLIAARFAAILFMRTKLTSKTSSIIAPAISLNVLASEVAERAGMSSSGVGVFLISGKFLTVKVSSQAFEEQMKRSGDDLVGVYDMFVDIRDLKEDLQLFSA